MSTKLKLLITSSGSLLGQNILDSLETRRDQIEICVRSEQNIHNYF